MQRLGTLTAALCRFAPQDMFKLRDVTEDAKEVVKCVRQLTSSPRSNYTLLHFVELFKGEQSGGLTCLMHVLFVVLQDSKTCASLVSSLLSCRFSKCLLHGCPFFFPVFFSSFSSDSQKHSHHGCPTCVLQIPKQCTSLLVCCRIPKLTHHLSYWDIFQDLITHVMDVPTVVLQDFKTCTSFMSYIDILQDSKTLASWMSQFFCFLFCRVPKLPHGWPDCCFAGSQNSCIMDVPIVVLQGPKTPASRMSQLLFCRVPKLPHHGCPNCCFAGSPNSRITDIPIIVL